MSGMYTPTTDEVRAKFADWYGDNEYRDIPEGWFDRWLAQVKADALREAAATDDPDHYIEVALGGGDYVRDWLNARADRIENGADQ